MPAQPPLVEVAVSVVRRGDGRVLLAERTARQTAAGYWELPGGKIDEGETAAAAAARELREEIGINALALRPWRVYEHAFPTKRVRLSLFVVDAWAGQPHGMEGQRVAWVDPAAPEVGPLLPSNIRALAALALPPLYAIVAIERHGQASAAASVEAAAAKGARLFQLRAPHLAPDQLVGWARRVAAAAACHGARVALVGSALQAHRAGLDGVHSTAAQLRCTSTRPPVRLWGASCHDAADLARAAALGADFAVLSPVLPSKAHPDLAPLGWERFGRLVRSVALPVYAQGGLNAGHLATAVEHGAAGIAVAVEALAGSDARDGGLRAA